MPNRKRILVVDDSANEIRIMLELLKPHYAVLAATSGAQAVELVAAEHQPDLVLLDVTMEPMDGYQTCVKILEQKPNLPIIFISANTETAEILKGFESGGIDYITKPICPELLLTKIKLALQQQTHINKLAAKKQQASSAALSAMNNAADMGILLNFAREGINLKTHYNLTNQLIVALKSYELEGCIQLRLNGETINESTGILQALETELLTRASEITQRLTSLGKRLIINYESISILIKNMPTEHVARCGELRDQLSSLAENAHNLSELLSHKNMREHLRHSAISAILVEAQQMLGNIQVFQKQHKENSVKIMDEMVTEIETNFLTLGLSEDQENTITNTIQKSIHSALQHMEQGFKADADLKKITDSLGRLTHL